MEIISNNQHNKSLSLSHPATLINASTTNLKFYTADLIDWQIKDNQKNVVFLMQVTRKSILLTLPNKTLVACMDINTTSPNPFMTISVQSDGMMRNLGTSRRLNATQWSLQVFDTKSRHFQLDLNNELTIKDLGNPASVAGKFTKGLFQTKKGTLSLNGQLSSSISIALILSTCFAIHQKANPNWP